MHANLPVLLPLLCLPMQLGIPWTSKPLLSRVQKHQFQAMVPGCAAVDASLCLLLLLWLVVRLVRAGC